jgi:uncharacterized protein
VPRSTRRVDAHLHLSAYWPDIGKNSYGPEVDFTVRGLLRELDGEGVRDGLLLQIFQSPNVEETLREGRELWEQSGGRLMATATVDPTQGADAILRALALWDRSPDLKAIKLYPGYLPFYPHDPRLGPVYEFAARRKIPVLFHQGDTMDPLGRIRFARPIEVDEVAVRYRDVNFVLCHLGNPWVEETAELVYKNENVYTDTSGLLAPPRVPHFEAMFHRAQRRLFNAIASVGDVSRFLYGSDWPLESISTAVRLIEGLDLSEAERERILGENARKLFRLDE